MPTINIAITLGLALVLALAAACTGSDPADRPEPPNTAQTSPARAQPETTSAPAPTGEPLTITLETTRAPHAAVAQEEEATPTGLERTRSPGAMDNICWRTPEVQDKLIEDLRIPSCQLINEGELFRIQKFDVDTPHVAPGDFAHMLNLRELQTEELRKLPEAGTFDGLSTLERLTIRIDSDGWGEHTPTEFTLSKGTFDDLQSLKSLEISSRVGNIILEEGTLDELDQLVHISLGGIREISSRDLAGLSQLRSIDMQLEWPPSGQAQDAPVFPKDLIARLPMVETLTIQGFQWPTALEVNSLEHACILKEKGYIPEDTVMTTGGKIIQYQDRETRDGRSFCILKVEDEIQEVPLPTP